LEGSGLGTGFYGASLKAVGCGEVQIPFFAGQDMARLEGTR
jgi:hypothetical protein